MVNSTLYGKSRRRSFAQGKSYIALSNICAQGQKPGILRTHTGQYAAAAPALSRPHGRPRAGGGKPPAGP